MGAWRETARGTGHPIPKRGIGRISEQPIIPQATGLTHLTIRSAIRAGKTRLTIVLYLFSYENDRETAVPDPLERRKIQ